MRPEGLGLVALWLCFRRPSHFKAQASQAPTHALILLPSHSREILDSIPSHFIQSLTILGTSISDDRKTVTCRLTASPPTNMAQVSSKAVNEPHFTVFVRLPFNRGDFIDPPPVCLASKFRHHDCLSMIGVVVCCKRTPAMGCDFQTKL